MPLEWPVRPVVRSIQLIAAAAGDRAVILAASRREILEFERDVGPAPGLDQVAPRDRDRRSDPFLVAGQDHHDVGIAQGSRRLHRPKRGEDDDDPAFVVADRRGRWRGCPGASKRWNGYPPRTRYRDGRSAGCACRARCRGGWRSDAPPARSRACPTQRTSKPSCSNSGAEHVGDRASPRRGSGCRYSG